MKSTCVFASLLGATMVLGCSDFLEVAHAQDVPTLQSGLAPTVHRVIVLKNVPPTLVAWWIDPTHNVEPVQLTGSDLLNRKAVPAPQNQVKETTKGAFELPTGVKSVSPIVTQNALLVSGTEEGIEKLQETIKFLDIPLRQVEIEAQLVQIDDVDAKALGVDFGKENPDGFVLGFVRSDVRENLKRLVNENKAKVISAPRVTTNNNKTTMLGSSQPSSTAIGYKDEQGKFQELFDPTAEKGNARLLLGAGFQLIVTPTINADDTITLVMSPKRVLQLSSEANDQTIKLRDLGGLLTIVNIRDGETVALKGLSSHFFVPIGHEKKTATSNVLLLATARIVRHAGNDVQPVALRR